MPDAEVIDIDRELQTEREMIPVREPMRIIPLYAWPDGGTMMVGRAKIVKGADGNPTLETIEEFRKATQAEIDEWKRSGGKFLRGGLQAAPAESEEEDHEKKGSWLPWALGGLAAAGLVTGLVMAYRDETADPDDDTSLDEDSDDDESEDDEE